MDDNENLETLITNEQLTPDQLNEFFKSLEPKMQKSIKKSLESFTKNTNNISLESTDSSNIPLDEEIPKTPSKGLVNKISSTKPTSFKGISSLFPKRTKEDIAESSKEQVLASTKDLKPSKPSSSVLKSTLTTTKPITSTTRLVPSKPIPSRKSVV